MKKPRNQKLKDFVNQLGLRVEKAEISFEQALRETKDSLRNHPAILALLNRN